MRFVYPYILLALSILPIVALVWIWLHRRAEQRLGLLIAPALQEKLMPQSWQGRFYLQFVLVTAGLALLVFAAARPQWGRKDEKAISRGRNVVIALDVSRSMLAADVHPNRLERAKTDIMDLIDDLKGDRAALLAFRNKGSLLCPLTTDYAFLRQALDGASPESAPRGETDLGDAIRKSLEALDPALDENNAILMISDGEDLKGDAVAAARKAAERNIPIFTVGIGDPSGATIPNDKGSGTQQYKGTTVKTRLVDKTLSAIAEASHGRYIPLGTAGTAQTTLGAIYRRYLTQVAAREQVEQIENRYQERYQLFLLPALLCLLTAAAFSKGRLALRSTVIMKAAAMLALLAGTAAGETNAPPADATNAPPVVVAPGRAGAREAQSLLRKGECRKAAEAFLSAMRGADLEEAETYRYDAAYAYYMDKDFDRTVETLRPLLSSKKNGAKAGEFLGKAMMEKASAAKAQSSTNAPAEPPEVTKLNALKDAAEGFQRALRDTPQDERRNRNMTRAISPLAEARDAAHIASVLKETGKTPPDQLTAQMLAEQRAIMKEGEGVFTNDAPAMIAQAEALAARQDKQADIWIPLKQQMLQAVTNQEQQAKMVQQIELVRDSMKGAATAWRDVLPDAANESAQSEPAAYQFWKMLAAPDASIAEDIMCQSNSIHSLNEPYYADKDTQAEAYSLTQLFRQRFPQWAQQYRQQAQSDTNMPPFTEKDQAKIEKLVGHAEAIQKEVAGGKALAAEKKSLQEQALKDLIEAQKLLPKRSNQNNQNQQKQQQQQQQQKQEQKQQPQEQKQEQKQTQEQKKQEQPKDVQEVLRRALEREKEHEQEKKERMRNMPLAPNERDW
jgi:Ca-activated chloride channel family protein